ncbi:MAG: toast rack family protein [Chloroflexi bacterium]|nr:toast rack family protein [Chloroflexota bacterium]
MFRKMYPIILILTLVLTACSFHISLPITQPAGPETTDAINVPLPTDATQSVDLSLAFGAGTLKLHPGAGALVSGTATYNVSDFKPTVTVNASTVRIQQGNWRLTGIPDISNIKNEWDLALGNVPLALTIDAGAYQAEYELGGLALTNLTISDGAADTKLNFASPNLTGMSLLSYSTGASNVSLTGLGNANFASLEFNSGAGNYTLDFSGQFKRNGSVHIGTGVSNLTLVIPSGIPVQITVDGGLSNVTQDSSWARNGNVYSQTGTGPQLTIVVKIGAGNITITR